MLADGRSLAEVLEISRRAFGGAESTFDKANNYVVTLAILKKLPGPWMTGKQADRVRAAATEVVRGGE